MQNLFKKKIIKDFIDTGSAGVLGAIFSFLRSLFLIRYVGSEDYGKFQYLFALYVTSEMLCFNLDLVIKRYLKENPHLKDAIFSANFISKFFIFTVCACFITTYVYFKGSFAITGLWTWLIILTLFRIAVGFLINSFGAALQAHLHYKPVNKTQNITNLSLLIFIIVLSKFFQLRGIELLFWFYLLWCASMVVGAGYLITNFKNKVGSFHWSISLNSFKIGLWDFKKYFLPMIGTSFSGYIKLYLPAFLLGQTSQFEAVAYYEVIKKIFGLIHKQIPSIMMALVPSLVGAQKGSAFKSKWTKAMAMYFTTNFLGSLCVFFFGPLIFHFYKIEWNTTIQLVILIFSLGLILGTWTQANQMLVFTTHNTSIIFLSSVVRQSCFAIYLLFTYKILNPVLLAAGVNGMQIATVALFVIYSIRQDKGNIPLQITYFLWTSLLCAIVVLIHYFGNPLPLLQLI